MTLRVDRKALDRLWGSELKIISAAADVPAVQEALDAEAASLGIEHVSFRPADDGEPPSLQSAASPEPDWTTMKAPPTGPCCLVAVSDESLVSLEGLRSWWAQYGAEPAPQVFDLRVAADQSAGHGTACSAELYRRMFRLAWQEAGQAAERVTRLQGELYELRREYGQVRLSMEKLLDRVDRLRHATAELIHVMPADGEVYRANSPKASLLRQPLPVSAEGLAAIDLCSPLPASGRIGDGLLILVLRARETAEALATWSVPYGALGAGWFRCTVPRALTSSQHQLDLEVAWQTLDGEVPALALSPIGAFHELAAAVDGRAMPQSLAWMLWGALPGSRLHSSPGVFACEAAGSGNTIEYRLDAPTIARLQPGATAHFPYMHPLCDVPGFRLHPLDHTLATASLARGCWPGTDRLAATAEIRMKDAKHPVEYAICLTDAAASCAKFPEEPRGDSRVLGFSDWQAVPADGQPHAVILTLPEPLDRPADLHFATRMTDGHSMVNHWADWLEVRIRVRRHTVVNGATAPHDASEAGAEGESEP